eukprot:Phypoly_transcript_29195.p1 GENE.Phypoly_transcript_29195~~Phypoly_transcript_29195.p1  ORF type:complete len:117 (+),score=5.36 Phypoly_transcript_29195:18-368(+)
MNEEEVIKNNLDARPGLQVEGGHVEKLHIRDHVHDADSSTRYMKVGLDVRPGLELRGDGTVGHIDVRNSVTPQCERASNIVSVPMNKNVTKDYLRGTQRGDIEGIVSVPLACRARL